MPTPASSRSTRALTRLMLLAAVPVALGGVTGVASAFPGPNGRIVLNDGYVGDIGTVAASGGTPKLLTTGDDAAASPDGTRYVYNDPNGISIVNADGTGHHTISASGNQPAWSPDGKQIVYSLTSDSDVTHLEVINADGTNAHALTSGTTSAQADDRNPAWSPDGTKIAFTRGGCDSSGGGSCIFVINANGTGAANLTPEPQFSCDGNVFSQNTVSTAPTWSPDGTKIAYSGFAGCQPGGEGTDIWSMNAADGSGKVDLAPDAGTEDRLPTWSPDGTTIAFLSTRFDGVNYELYTVPASGGSPSHVSITWKNSPDHPANPDWARAVPSRKTTLSLTATSTTIKGKTTKDTLSGLLLPPTGVTPYAGQKVTIQRKLPGSTTWTALTGGTRTTSTTGGYTLTFTPGKTASYRAVYAANATLGLQASTSPTVTITVK